ncbi:capsular biosynthesis protein [Xenorhabdus bovienii]|uniref:capsular biosynthesis protein n=1 Tax=Xenorhabdus bovienii TaxID=40576 RepID=UPI0023B2D1D6|nr:capsular biosynthesis protein [Xenorhabdus bovienii]MDE9554972.1 capsular biosynthesis protein [Xenorhabdus bovienii]
MSAAYVGQDLKAEFGNIPPCMLPLGNKRLYKYQVELAEENEDVYISLPESYKLSHNDKTWFTKNDIEIIYLPDEITIGESLVTAINTIVFKKSPSLRILFGDTLIKPVPSGEDIIITSEKNDGYSWGTYEDNESIIAGYFSISDPGLLVRSIIKARWNFVDGIKIYNENKSLRNTSDLDWYDFGHINKYYQSKAAFTTQRAFNDLKINKDWIEKRSSNNLKIKAEANWFSSLPPQLKIYIPQYLGDAVDEHGNYSYQLEYLYNTPLNELYIFSEIEPAIWNKIIKKCLAFVDDCLKFKKSFSNSDSNSLRGLFSDKTRARIVLFLEEQQISIKKEWSLNSGNPTSLEKMIDETECFIDSILVGDETIVHGDFCFSNILYDFRTDRIKVIDPRGMDAKGDLKIYGNIHYDITKLAHSIIGLYDWIISGFYELNVNTVSGHIDFKINLNKDVSKIQFNFVSLVNSKYNISYKTLCAMQVHLFISMLPLHNDDQRRQYALLANAFRLFKEFKEAEI